MTNTTVGDVPFEKLRIGDRVISCTGKHGTIAVLYPVGSTDPWGNNYDDWGGGILFLWNHQNVGTYSFSGWSESPVEYIGDKDFPNPCSVMCNWKRS